MPTRTHRARAPRRTALRLGAIATTALVAVGVAAPPADAVVLVNAPAGRVHVHHAIAVGVWYRAWDGGPRVYRLKVLDPDGRAVFARHGAAPKRWKIWHVRLDRPGVFTTVYRVKDSDGKWVRSAMRTRAVRG